MARRERVTRLKSHRKKRNKNPKLSPFQREQKRNKLANQPPTINPDERDAPKSQRLVLAYLEEKQKKKEAKKAEALRLRAEKQLVGASPSSNKDGAAETQKQKAKDHSEKDSKTSLNALLGSSLGPALVSFPTSNSTAENSASSVSSIIARKKEKKHQKRVEARRERVKSQVEKLSEELKKLTAKKGSKRLKNKDPNAAFEKELLAMQRQKALEVKKEKQQQRHTEHQAEDDKTHDDTRAAAATPSNGKKISFDESALKDEGTKKHVVAGATRNSKRVRDFSDLVDVVRFNERVEAPPVFDAVPNRNAAVSRLARELEQPSEGKSLRHRLLSSVGGLGEQKRLSRLGLAPAATQVSLPAAVAAAKMKLSKEKEMEALRNHVMAAYQKKKRRNIEEKKGVDMTHVFPSL